MSKIIFKIKAELAKLVVPTIFFMLVLHFVVFLRSLMLQGANVQFEASFSATLGALIIAKAIVIADLLPFMNYFSSKPLIFSVVWKTFIYAIIATLLHYLERLIESWKHAEGFVSANEALWQEIIWPHFWAIQIFIFVMLLFYTTCRELILVIGAKHVKKVLFG